MNVKNQVVQFYRLSLVVSLIASSNTNTGQNCQPLNKKLLFHYYVCSLSLRTHPCPSTMFTSLVPLARNPGGAKEEHRPASRAPEFKSTPVRLQGRVQLPGPGSRNSWAPPPADGGSAEARSAAVLVRSG